MKHRLLITGERDWTDRDAVANFIASQLMGCASGDVLVVVHGDCETGADRFARDFCEKVGIEQDRHPANWYPNGRAGGIDYSAGPRRNGKMVLLGAYLCGAFWSGRTKKSGTFDCFTQAVQAGIPVKIIPRRRAP